VPQDCRQVNIRNVKIVSWKFGSDGIDLVATSGVRVADCFLRCNDDCIAIKGWGGTEKYPQTPQKGPNISDIAVRNTVFWNMAWGNAIDIGFELRCDLVSNLSFTDCDVVHVDRGAVFSIHNGDYATVQDVRVENLRVEDAMHKLIDVAIFLSQYSLDRPQDEAERKRRYQRGCKYLPARRPSLPPTGGTSRTSCSKTSALPTASSRSRSSRATTPRTRSRTCGSRT
nr:glycosyl hydrolase family 28 protein [Bernardetiaceae bacterium]